MTDKQELMKDIPARTWVALSHDETKVVATGGSYGETVDRAEAAGELDPVMTIKSDPEALQMLFL